VFLELVPALCEGRLPGNRNAHLCLRADNVEAALLELKSKGTHVKEIQDKGDGLLGSFEDPDGNEICLWQDKRT
jgi:predicted enzyme related to lactoylglutathione lyase